MVEIGIHKAMGRINELESLNAELVEALKHAKQMIDKALPKFNWGDSFLDAKAITLLNEAPISVNKALARATKEQS